MPWLINAAQLEKFRKSQKSLIILDASWHHPSDNRDAKKEFVENHILDAQFFDITLFRDPNTDVPNMLSLDEKSISEKLSALGIRNDYKIIIYDNSDVHSACRALWMLKMFGHNSQQLYILDGGLKAWESFNGKMESGESRISSKQYTATIQPQHLRTLTQMKQNLHEPKEQIVDVRHPVRFCGGSEGREGLRSGHIPGSFSFPFFTMYEPDGTLKPLEKIRNQMSDVSISLIHPIITSCGSGMHLS
jgi:thiosulfate/3-mercaptopyruvate sulfurtransferase